jgi:DUF438 domain-containing protein
MKDPIVEEVRKAREEHANKFKNSLSEISRDLKSKEAACGHPVVNFPPKRFLKATGS